MAIDNSFLPNGYILEGKEYKYEIKRVLGQGAFGVTYLASMEIEAKGALGNLVSSAPVTVKEFFMEDVNGREKTAVTSSGVSALYNNYKQKFAREAQNLSKLKHKNIVNVLEFFEANNTIYYSMEFLRGGSLDDLIEKKGKLSEKETLNFSRQICEALKFMHKDQMLHLDLKPGNIMLRNENEAVLIDFGLSKHYDKDGNPESSTTIGSGTPGYAPIEQGQENQDYTFQPTLDVYALGATMFKMLTGKRAPEASYILNEGFPKDILQKAAVGEDFIKLIIKAMMPLRKNRYQNIDEVLADLEKIKIDSKPAGGSTTTTSNESFERDEETIVDNNSRPSTPVNPKLSQDDKNTFEKDCETIIDTKNIPNPTPAPQGNKSSMTNVEPKMTPQPEIPTSPKTPSKSKGKQFGIIAGIIGGVLLLLFIFIMSTDTDETNTKDNTEIDYVESSEDVNSIQSEYDEIGRFSCGRAYVSNDGKYGYIDEDGNVVIELIYDDAFDFTDDRGLVVLDGKYGFVDLYGNLVIPAHYDDAKSFKNGKTKVVTDGLTLVLDVDGNILN